MDDKAIDRKKEFEKLFNEMCHDRGLNRKEAWSDLMYMFACAISNATEPYEKRRESRERAWERIRDKFGGMQKPSILLSTLALALIENPAQDFLGDMYMKLSMGERAWGQVFTPYHICNLMAQLTNDLPEEEINEKGYISVQDPAVGGGAMIIAEAEILRNAGYDTEKCMLAQGQDIDITAVNMAYVQLSLIGVPAVLICGDSLKDPYTGHPMFIEDDENLWYTPSLFNKVWDERRLELIKEAEDLKEKTA